MFNTKGSNEHIQNIEADAFKKNNHLKRYVLLTKTWSIFDRLLFVCWSWLFSIYPRLGIFHGVVFS